MFSYHHMQVYKSFSQQSAKCRCSHIGNNLDAIDNRMDGHSIVCSLCGHTVECYTAWECTNCNHQQPRGWISPSKNSPVRKSTYHIIRFIIIWSANPGKPFTIIRSQIVVTLGEQWWGETWEVFWGAGKVLFLNLGTGYSGVFALWEFINLYTQHFCTFLYVYYTSIKSTQRENHYWKRWEKIPSDLRRTWVG